MSQEITSLDGFDLGVVNTAEIACQRIIGNLDLYQLVSLQYCEVPNRVRAKEGRTTIYISCRTSHYGGRDKSIAKYWEGLILCDNKMMVRDVYIREERSENFEHHLGPFCIKDKAHPKMNRRNLLKRFGIALPCITRPI